MTKPERKILKDVVSNNEEPSLPKFKKHRAISLRHSSYSWVAQDRERTPRDDGVADIMRHALQRLGLVEPLTGNQKWNLGGALKRMLRELGHDPAAPPTGPFPVPPELIARLDLVLGELRASRPDLKTTESRVRAAVRSSGINLPNGWGRRKWDEEWEALRGIIGDERFKPLGDLAGWATHRGLVWSSLSRADLDLYEQERSVDRGWKGARQNFLAVVAGLRDAYSATATAVPENWPRPYEGEFRYAIARSDCSSSYLQSLDTATNGIVALQWNQENPLRPDIVESDLRRLTRAHCDAHGTSPADLSSVGVLHEPAAAARTIANIRSRPGVDGLYAYQAASTLCHLCEIWKPFDPLKLKDLHRIRASLSAEQDDSLSEGRLGLIISYLQADAALALVRLPGVVFSEALAASTSNLRALRTALAMQLGMSFAMTVDQIADVVVGSFAGASCGASKAEIVKVAGGQRVIQLGQTRRADRRKFPVGGQTLTMLEQYLEAVHPEDMIEPFYLFGGRDADRARVTTVSRAMGELIEDRVPKPFKPHDLPLVAATILMGAGGMEREKVRIWLGRRFHQRDPFLDEVESRLAIGEIDGSKDAKQKQ